MTGSIATVEHDYQIPEDRGPDVPTVPFRINGEAFTMVMPKMSIALSLLNLIEGDPEKVRSTHELGIALADLLWQMVQYIEDEPDEPPVLFREPDDPESAYSNPKAGQPRGRSRVVQRLRNPRDSMDIMDLAPLFRDVVQTMFEGRPTGPSRGYSPEPHDGGPASEAPTSEPQAATPSSSSPARSGAQRSTGAAASSRKPSHTQKKAPGPKRKRTTNGSSRA
jgi:hypothetical protein